MNVQVIPVDPFVLARVLDTFTDEAEPVTMVDAHRHGPAGLVTVQHTVRVHGHAVAVPVQRITSALPTSTTGRFGITIRS